MGRGDSHPPSSVPVKHALIQIPIAIVQDPRIWPAAVYSITTPRELTHQFSFSDLASFQVMLHVPDLPEADAVRILRHFLSQAATAAETPEGAPAPAPVIQPEVPSDGGGAPPPAKRAKGGNLSKEVSPDAVQGDAGVVVAVLSGPSKKRGAEAVAEKVGSGGGGEDKASKKKKVGQEKTSAGGDEDGGGGVRDAAAGDQKTSNGNGTLMTTKAGLSNGHAATHDDGGTSSDSGGVSDGGKQAVVNGAKGTGGEGATRNSKGDKKDITGATATAAARAERGVRVALTLPHNEAFLRSALAELSHREVVVVLKVSAALVLRCDDASWRLFWFLLLGGHSDGIFVLKIPVLFAFEVEQARSSAASYVVTERSRTRSEYRG